MSLPEYSPELLSHAAVLVPEYQVPAQSYLLANSLDDLNRFNADVQPNAGGELTRVGLRIVPDAFDDGAIVGIRVSELPQLAPEIRQLRNITVRGCFVCGHLDGLHGKELGRFFRACYECAKQMRVILVIRLVINIRKLIQRNVVLPYIGVANLHVLGDCHLLS